MAFNFLTGSLYFMPTYLLFEWSLKFTEKFKESQKPLKPVQKHEYSGGFIHR